MGKIEICNILQTPLISDIYHLRKKLKHQSFEEPKKCQDTDITTTPTPTTRTRTMVTTTSIPDNEATHPNRLVEQFMAAMVPK